MQTIRTFSTYLSVTLMLAFVGCSGSANTTDHGELPEGAVIEVRFDEPSTNLLAYEIEGSQIISKGGESSWESSTAYGFQKVENGEAWTYEVEEDRNGLSASFKTHSDIGFTAQLKSGDKVLQTVKSDDSNAVTLLAGTVRNESSVDATDIQIDAEQSEYVRKLLTEWLAGDDIRPYLDDSFTEDVVSGLILGGPAVQETFSPDIEEAVQRFAAWEPESGERVVLSMWGVLVKEDGKELFVELGRDKAGKLHSFQVDGPLMEKITVGE